MLFVEAGGGGGPAGGIAVRILASDKRNKCLNNHLVCSTAHEKWGENFAAARSVLSAPPSPLITTAIAKYSRIFALQLKIVVALK